MQLVVVVGNGLNCNHGASVAHEHSIASFVDIAYWMPVDRRRCSYIFVEQYEDCIKKPLRKEVVKVLSKMRSAQSQRPWLTACGTYHDLQTSA